MIHTDYIYKDKKDALRFRIFSVDADGILYWDVDVFAKNEGGYSYTFSTECAEFFNKKRDAKKWIEENFGKVISIQPKNTVIEGWK